MRASRPSPSHYLALRAIIAVSIVAALGLLTVALLGTETSLAAVVRSCIQTGGSLLAVGIVALLAGLVLAFSVLRTNRPGDRP